ncbi:MAG: hypothetical protein M0P47_11700 [Bacteroidales bacterium]|nr:hypothetical protein [Bacteroidales bacterium]
MKKPLWLTCFLLLIFSPTFSQNQEPERKFQITLKSCLQYKTFFASKYIEKTENDPSDIIAHQYDRFTKNPTFGFQTGVQINRKIFKNLSIGSGILVSIRNDLYEGNIDTVHRYHTPTSIHDIIKYDYNFCTLGVPLLVVYRIKRFELSVGVNIEFVSFKKARFTYLSAPDKIVYSTNYFTSFLPAFQINYLIPIDKISLGPLLEMEIGKEKSFYLSTGIVVKFNRK